MKMSKRKGYEEIEQGNVPSFGESKKNADARLQLMHLKEQESFIKKGYLLCMLLFLATGVAMTTAILEGTYADAILAETIMVTFFGTTWVLLFIVMVCCYGAPQIRIALLLFISMFIGTVAGFMIAANLKIVINHMQDSNTTG